VSVFLTARVVVGIDAHALLPVDLSLWTPKPSFCPALANFFFLFLPISICLDLLYLAHR